MYNYDLSSLECLTCFNVHQIESYVHIIRAAAILMYTLQKKYLNNSCRFSEYVLTHYLMTIESRSPWMFAHILCLYS